jgi:hypothetical protein
LRQSLPPIEREVNMPGDRDIYRRFWKVEETEKFRCAVSFLRPRLTPQYDRPMTGFGEIQGLSSIYYSLNKAFQNIPLVDDALYFGPEFPRDGWADSIIILGGDDNNIIMQEMKNKFLSRNFKLPTDFVFEDVVIDETLQDCLWEPPDIKVSGKQPDAPAFCFRNIRTVLMQGFSDVDLRRLCFDEPDFKPVYSELAEGVGKDRIIDKLLEYAEKGELVRTLLSLVEEYNPAQYKKHEPYVKVSTRYENQKTGDKKTQKKCAGLICRDISGDERMYYEPVINKHRRQIYVDYGILARYPNPFNTNSKLFVFAGCHTYGTAAAAMVSASQSILGKIEQVCGAYQDSEYFSAAIRCTVNQANPHFFDVDRIEAFYPLGLMKDNNRLQVQEDGIEENIDL